MDRWSPAGSCTPTPASACCGCPWTSPRPRAAPTLTLSPQRRRFARPWVSWCVAKCKPSTTRGLWSSFPSLACRRFFPPTTLVTTRARGGPRGSWAPWPPATSWRSCLCGGTSGAGPPAGVSFPSAAASASPARRGGRVREAWPAGMSWTASSGPSIPSGAASWSSGAVVPASFATWSWRTGSSGSQTSYSGPGKRRACS
mmetsp:Transcript_6791/g.19228  ORF Transcript_6791/g.19228 Transcript_6791/m.19228 type:complete len:200 (+) Transcript_6791:223-822(+)